MVCKSKTNIMTNRQTRKYLELVFHVAIIDMPYM